MSDRDSISEMSAQLRGMASLLKAKPRAEANQNWAVATHAEVIYQQVEAMFDWRRLRGWRGLVVLRDNLKCVMCDSTHNLEAHHCRPKALYPEIAYLINNGVTLCYRCHRVIVHGSNTFDLVSWDRFMPLWMEHMKSHAELNLKLQLELDAK